MKKKIILLTIGLLLFSCEKEQNPPLLSLEYVSSITTEPRPISIAIDRANGYIFIANLKPTSNDFSANIQKFNKQGDLLKSIFDFKTFDEGIFFRYLPIDLTIDNNHNLYILVQPLIEQTEETWITPTGYCILTFDINDNFQKEFNFSEIEGCPSSIAYSDNFIFVTNGRIIKKISIKNQQVFDLVLPNNLENNITWLDIHTTDMEINSEGIIYLTGQAAFFPDSVGCRITKFNIQTNQQINTYSINWTGVYGAKLNNPGFSINRNGSLYLATFYCMSIEVFNENMEFILRKEIRTIDGNNTLPIDVAISDNKIYVVDNLNNQIHVYKEN